MKTPEASAVGATSIGTPIKRSREHDPDKTILQPENTLFCGVNILEESAGGAEAAVDNEIQLLVYAPTGVAR